MNQVARLLTIAALAAALDSAVFADEATPVDANLHTLDSVRSRVRIGTEIFLDPSHKREEIQMHFRRMKELGISLARVFVIWDHVERKPGQWSFDLYDAAYDAAAANGIPMLTTLCPEDPPGWTRQCPSITRNSSSTRRTIAGTPPSIFGGWWSDTRTIPPRGHGHWPMSRVCPNRSTTPPCGSSARGSGHATGP